MCLRIYVCVHTSVCYVCINPFMLHICAVCSECVHVCMQYVYACVIYMLNKNTLGVKKVRGQSEAALQTGVTKNFDIS